MSNPSRLFLRPEIVSPSVLSPLSLSHYAKTLGSLCYGYPPFLNGCTGFHSKPRRCNCPGTRNRVSSSDVGLADVWWGQCANECEYGADAHYGGQCWFDGATAGDDLRPH